MNTFKLNDGREIPQVGLGVFLSPKEQTVMAVETAIDAGYRLIDTASIYKNEEEVGDGLKSVSIPREELFITTKVWITDFGYENTLKAFDESLKRLKLDYLDLYLIHWPTPKHFEDTIGSYKALEKLRSDGLVKSIGVSNFNPEHLTRLFEATSVRPVLNQIEIHPFFNQKALINFNKQNSIISQAWSPIGGNRDHQRELLENTKLVEIANKYDKSTAQIILRWHLQNGVAVIPKSVTPERIKTNIELFDFELSASELEVVNGLDTGKRSGPDPLELN